MTFLQHPVRVAIVGAGAIGGVLASRLAAVPSVQLSVLARGATLTALQQDGLSMTDAQGSRTVALRASEDPADLGLQDLVIVAVKGPALAEVAPKVRSLLAPDGMAMIAMNGLPWWFLTAWVAPAKDSPCKAWTPAVISRRPFLHTKSLAAWCT